MTDLNIKPKKYIRRSRKLTQEQKDLFMKAMGSKVITRAEALIIADQFGITESQTYHMLKKFVDTGKIIQKLMLDGAKTDTRKTYYRRANL